ncbi:transposase [Burkholderia sp. 572]|uniref:transposase n=1 Tax=Burkholderia sp. 572 TaxID=3156414 RepID=UPI0033967E6D
MPYRSRSRAEGKAALVEILNAARAVAIVAYDQFIATYTAKYPKEAEKITKDPDELLVFYDFPVEHWRHMRTMNPFESAFAIVQHRTIPTRDGLSRA